MMNLQKVFALMGIHKFTSVFLRIIDCAPKHRGLGPGIAPFTPQPLLLAYPPTLPDLITCLFEDDAAELTARTTSELFADWGNMEGKKQKTKSKISLEKPAIPTVPTG